MAYRRRAHRAAAAGLSAAALLVAASCGGSSNADPDRVMTVAEALQADGDGRVRVRGWLVTVGDDVRLCSEVDGSNRCEEPSVRVRGLDFVGVSNMEQGKRLGRAFPRVTLVGDVDDGVLTVVQ